MVALIKTVGSTKTSYGAMTDRQGSLRALYNGSGLVQSFSYDAWGNRRNPSTGAALTTSELVAANSITSRGYTCHEHMDEFGLINMNARIYDPALGMFISVDPLAQEYYNTYPYAYCGGDPVNRVDWTGEDWYEDPYGNLFWQEGHEEVEGYTNIGPTATISWGEDIFFNYYQNMGVLGDTPADAVEVIGSSPSLMQQAFGRNSGLSDDSQIELFVTLQNGKKSDLARPIGMFVAENLLGGTIGKAAGWLFGKIAGWVSGKATGIYAEGYSSFAAFKKVYGLAGKGMSWHHIVEQNASNISKFGAERIHNINNMVKLPHGKGSIHAKISGYYSSKIPGTNIRVRDYVNTLSYDEQYKYGIDILNKFGWKP